MPSCNVLIADTVKQALPLATTRTCYRFFKTLAAVHGIKRGAMVLIEHDRLFR